MARNDSEKAVQQFAPGNPPVLAAVAEHGIETLIGAPWSAKTVIRLRERLA